MQENARKLQTHIGNWFEQSVGLPENVSAIGVAIASCAVLILCALAIDRFAGWIIRSLVPSIVRRLGLTRDTEWLEALRDRFVARRSAHILAVLTFYWLVPLALDGFPELLAVVRNLIEGYVVVIIIVAINSILRASGDVLVDENLPSGVSLRFATQGAQIVVWVVGIILGVSVVFDTSVTILLSGMAGMTAVMLLVFRDSILGFVAGIQLAGNDMLRINDWIEVPQYGADGIVTDIGLTTVKVQNFDRTISTVPTYALVSESFRNWRGMQESGARRIMRAVSADMDRISFLTDEMIERLREIELLRGYFDRKLADIELHNKQFSKETRRPPNARGLTNIGAFRVYLEQYLRQHPDIRDDMTLIVRQLPPGPEGFPIQLYAFSSKQDWREYERIQADIFDHVLAIMPEFGLKAFQGPTSDEYLRNA
tara:strand:+ start:10754 stop:12031 length:1278 start_codon:yes stop_codon:yes gene_type:complete